MAQYLKYQLTSAKNSYFLLMKILKFSKYNLKKVSFIILISLFCLSPRQLVGQLKKQFIVVLDAGHGGRDSGALRGSYYESKIALKVALQIGKLLKGNKDIKVVFTRTKDVFIELHRRAKIANKNGADLFVSIHCNATKSRRPYGSETFVLGLSGNKKNLEIAKRENAVILLEDNYKQNYDYDPNSPESVLGLSVLQEENLDASLLFAGFVENNFVKAKRHSRGVKQANFLVLRETVMPSVLIELGFISNKKEGKFLNGKTGQLKMATAVTKAIQKYIKQLKLNTVVETKTTTPSATKRNTYFKVQIGASKKKIPLKSYNFKGLKKVERIQQKGLYKYYYGGSSNYQSVKSALKIAKQKGYKDAFIVAFKNSKRISIKEALKK